LSTPDPEIPPRPDEPAPGPEAEPRGPEPELAPDDERMNDWLDRQLGPADAKAFESELESDPARKKEARTLASVLARLRELPDEKAPSHLLEDVQSDIRHRSRGRYFGYHWKYRFPWEALVNALLLVGAVVVYVSMRAETPRLVPVEAKTFLVSGSDLGVGARILSDYGSFKRDPERAEQPGDAWVYLVGEVPLSRIEALRAELSLYPSMRVDAEQVVGEVVTVHVAIKR